MKIAIGVMVVVITLLIYWVATLAEEKHWLKLELNDYKIDLNTYKNTNNKKNMEIMKLNNTIRSLKPEVKEQVLDHMAEQQREILEEKYS